MIPLLKSLENQETEKGYNENKEEIENLKKEQAIQNPEQYSEEAQQIIAEKLEENKVKEEELNEENQQTFQKLKKGEIKDPEQLVVAETKIKANIYQKEAEKKITYLTSQVKEILNSNLSKLSSQIVTLKKELLAFINSANLYYSNQREKAEKLLTKLENHSTLNNSRNDSLPKPPNFPWKIVIPFLLASILLISVRIILIKRKK